MTDAADKTVPLESKQLVSSSAMAPTVEMTFREPGDAPAAATPEQSWPGESAPSKPGAFPVSHNPYLAHIGESRAAVIGIETILAGPTAALETAQRLVAAGFNALVVPLFDDGHTLYPSAEMAERGLPRQHPDLRRRDVLAEMCAAAARLNVILLLSVDFLMAGDRGLGVRYPALRRRGRWAMRNASGRLLPLGPETQRPMFCPSSRHVLDYYASVCCEAATSYPVSGFILEMPPLPPAAPAAPASDFCYCRDCRERFLNELTGGDNPADHQADPGFQLRKNWHFRRRVQQAILHVRNRVMESRPDCLMFLQGAMRRGPGALNLDPGTAWYPLAANGAVDGVFISNYSFRTGQFAAELEEDAVLLPSTANLCAALGSIRADTLGEQIAALRRQGAAGFLALHAAGLSPEAMAQLEHDALPWPAFHVESAPRRAVESSLRRLHYMNAGSPPLSALFRDIARFFAQRWNRLVIGDVEAMIDNLESVRRKAAVGALPVSGGPEKLLRLMAPLQKSLFMLCKTLRG